MAHRLRSRLLRIALGAVFSVIALLGLVLLFLLHPAGRNLIARQVEGAVKDQLGLELAITHVDRLDFWGIDLRTLRLSDADGRELGSVRSISVRLAPLALVTGTLRVTRVDIAGVRGKYDVPEADETKKPPESETADQSAGAFEVRVDALTLRDVDFRTRYGGRPYRAVIGTIAGGGRYGENPAVALEQASLRIESGRDVLLELSSSEGRWDAESGGKVTLKGELAGAPLFIGAKARALSDETPWPVESLALRITELDRRALLALGVEDGGGLRKAIDLDLAAKSEGERLEANVTVQAGRSTLTLAGSGTLQQAELSLELSPTLLSSLSTTLPELTVSGGLMAKYRRDVVPARLDVGWNQVRIDQNKLPNGVVHASLPLPVVRVEQVDIVGLEQVLHIAGQYHTETSAGRLELDVDEMRLAELPLLAERGLSGTLEGALRAHIEADQVDAQGWLSGRKLAAGANHVRELDLALVVAGPLARPNLTLGTTVKQARAGSVAVDRLTSELKAQGNRFEGSMFVQGPDTSLRTELGGLRLDDGSVRLQAIGRGQVAARKLTFDLRDVLYAQGDLSVGGLLVTSDRQRLRASGSLSSESEVRAQLALSAIDIGTWAGLANVKNASGTLDGTATVEGTTDEPRLNTQLSVSKLALDAQPPLDGTLVASADLGSGDIATEVSVSSKGDGLNARAKLALALGKHPKDLARALERARYLASVDASVPVGRMSHLGGDKLAALSGTIATKLSAEGTLDAPNVDASIAAELALPTQPDMPEEALRAVLSIRPENGTVSVHAKDNQGQLLDLEGSVDWPHGNLRDALEDPQSFRTSAFRLNGQLAERRLDTLQGVFAYLANVYELNLPMRTSAKVALVGTGDKLDGTLQARTLIYSDRLDAECVLGAQSTVDIDAEMAENRLEVKMSASADEGKLSAKLSAPLTLSTVLSGGADMQAVTVEARGERIAISKLPGLCSLASGSADFALEGRAFGKSPPVLSMDLNVQDLQAKQGASLGAQVHAQADHKAAELQAKLAIDGHQGGLITARVPFAYDKGPLPTLAQDKPLDARVRFKALPLAPLLSFTEALGRVGGSASADLAVTGTMRAPVPKGFIELHNAGFSIASLAQPFRKVNGRVEIDGRAVALRGLTARDRGGELRVDASAKLAPDGSGDGRLTLRAEKFPMRQQGMVVGELTTRTTVSAKLTPDEQLALGVKILSGRVWLTGEKGRNVQALEKHPDIRFAEEAVVVAEDDTSAKTSITLSSLEIETQKDLWLMHEDFSIQLGVDLSLTNTDGVSKLEGEATIKRGELALLGKNFRIEKGAVRFTGDMPPEPELDLKARYEPPTGEALIVQVSGRASAPVVTFSGAATDAGGAVAVLSGVGGGGGQSRGGAENQAQTDARNFALGVTAGLLTVTARRELGDWVPMLSVEANEEGTPNRARAGFDASDLIPDFLHGIARGAYVEGIVGSTPENSGGSVGLGVRFELAFPWDIVTSVGYGPGATWSTDVAWSP